MDGPAFTGDQWQWPFDFATHHHEDGVPEPFYVDGVMQYWCADAVNELLRQQMYQRIG